MARYVVADDQKNTAIVAIIGLCIQQANGSSCQWLEDMTNSNRQKYFR